MLRQRCWNEKQPYICIYDYVSLVLKKNVSSNLTVMSYKSYTSQIWLKERIYIFFIDKNTTLAWSAYSLLVIIPFHFLTFCIFIACNIIFYVLAPHFTGCISNFWWHLCIWISISNIIESHISSIWLENNNDDDDNFLNGRVVKMLKIVIATKNIPTKKQYFILMYLVDIQW